LRAIGLPARRLNWILVWQGVALATAVVVVGLPLGIATGSVLWRSFADRLGVDNRPVFALLLALLVPLAVCVGVVASLASVRRARQLHVASLLHSE
jgi:ABC-type lipoprotein release transport system permease subunit